MRAWAWRTRSRSRTAGPRRTTPRWWPWPSSQCERGEISLPAWADHHRAAPHRGSYDGRTMHVPSGAAGSPPTSSEGVPDPAWALILGVSSGTGAAIAEAVARKPGLNVFGVHRGRYMDTARELE